MFKTEMKEKKNGEVVIEDIDAKILRLMIKWMYTRDIETIDLKDKLDLFKAAHRYQIKSLNSWCMDKIIKKLSHENALSMNDVGDLYDEIQIKKKALGIIRA